MTFSQPLSLHNRKNYLPLIKNIKKRFLEKRTEKILKESVALINEECEKFSLTLYQKTQEQLNSNNLIMFSFKLPTLIDELLPKKEELQFLLELIQKNLNDLDEFFGLSNSLTLPSSFPSVLNISQGTKEQTVTLFLSKYVEEEGNKLWSRTLRKKLLPSLPLPLKALINDKANELKIYTYLLKATTNTYDQELERFNKELDQRLKGYLKRLEHHLKQHWQNQITSQIYKRHYELLQTKN